MTIAVPPPPAGDAMLAPARADARVLAFLNTRRSCPVPALHGPGPTEEELAQILRLAARVPDHRRVTPWRFLVFAGKARHRAGALFAERYGQLHGDASAEDLAREARRFAHAPVVVAVIFSPDRAHKTPVFEQMLSAGALCYNLLLAANAAGFAGNWLTGWMAEDEGIARALGLEPGERIAGFIHLGRADGQVRERPRPDMASLVRHWSGA